jgi:Bacterial capsule synthesis protein PGA_cap
MGRPVLSFEPVVLECDRCQLLLVGDLTWPEDDIPSVALSDGIASSCSLLPNLEGAVLPTRHPPLASGRSFGLWSSPFVVDFLQGLGTQVIGGAGNHIVDYAGGVEAAWRACRKADITIAGVGPSAQQASRPIRVILADGCSVLLYFAGDRRMGCRGPSHAAWGSNLIDPKRDLALVEMLRLAFPEDVLAVVLHWGWELQPWPEPGQRRFASELAAAGVDVLVGHHAHVCQAWERVGGMTAFYGIGNFLLREGPYQGIDIAYPPESSHGAGIILGANAPSVVHFHTDSRRGVVKQVGPPVRPEDSFLRSFGDAYDPDSADYECFYREHNTVAWWYPVWSGDENRVARGIDGARLRGVAGLKRLRQMP